MTPQTRHNARRHRGKHARAPLDVHAACTPAATRASVFVCTDGRCRHRPRDPGVGARADEERHPHDDCAVAHPATRFRQQPAHGAGKAPSGLGAVWLRGDRRHKAELACEWAPVATTLVHMRERTTRLYHGEYVRAVGDEAGAASHSMSISFDRLSYDSQYAECLLAASRDTPKNPTQRLEVGATCYKLLQKKVPLQNIGDLPVYCPNKFRNVSNGLVVPLKHVLSLTGARENTRDVDTSTPPNPGERPRGCLPWYEHVAMVALGSLPASTVSRDVGFAEICCELACMTWYDYLAVHVSAWGEGAQTHATVTEAVTPMRDADMAAFVHRVSSMPPANIDEWRKAIYYELQTVHRITPNTGAPWAWDGWLDDASRAQDRQFVTRALGLVVTLNILHIIRAGDDSLDSVEPLVRLVMCLAKRDDHVAPMETGKPSPGVRRHLPDEDSASDLQVWTDWSYAIDAALVRWRIFAPPAQVQATSEQVQATPEQKCTYCDTSSVPQTATERGVVRAMNELSADGERKGEGGIGCDCWDVTSVRRVLRVTRSDTVGPPTGIRATREADRFGKPQGVGPQRQGPSERFRQRHPVVAAMARTNDEALFISEQRCIASSINDQKQDSRVVRFIAPYPFDSGARRFPDAPAFAQCFSAHLEAVRRPGLSAYEPDPEEQGKYTSVDALLAKVRPPVVSRTHASRESAMRE
jgi:hypothetical protein